MSSTELPGVQAAAAAVAPTVSAVRVADGERLRSVSLPGIGLNVRCRPGDRAGLPPALYVHGLGGSSQNWSALMPLLSDVVDGEAVDLPGFGDSPPPDDGNYSVTGHARAVIRLLDAEERGPVHLFGNSLGGAVATRVAAVRPDLVRTLTLISPALPEWRVQRPAVPTGLLAVPESHPCSPGSRRAGRRSSGRAESWHSVTAIRHGSPTKPSATRWPRWSDGWSCRTSGTR